jgi:hypothetical protein
MSAERYTPPVWGAGDTCRRLRCIGSSLFWQRRWNALAIRPSLLPHRLRQRALVVNMYWDCW